MSNSIQEKQIAHINGMYIIFLMLAILILAGFVGLQNPFYLVFLPFIFIGCIICCAGFVIIKPNEAAVYTFLGHYAGSLKKEGFYFVNPLVRNISPIREPLSLKAMTLQNGKQKINDELGNPIEVGIVVVWQIVDTVKAVFGVDNYAEFLSIQSDSCLRRIISMYPYDIATKSGNKKSLRGSNDEISLKLKQEIQEKVNIAGIEILEARITHLAYAPEIALAMLQRQQAAAIIDARKLIVEGAVSMVDMALKEITKNKIINLDEEQKAQMISNLLVVLCSSKDTQPIINTGSGGE